MTSPALAPRRASTKAAARLAACIPDVVNATCGDS